MAEFRIGLLFIIITTPSCLSAEKKYKTDGGHVAHLTETADSSKQTDIHYIRQALDNMGHYVRQLDEKIELIIRNIATTSVHDIMAKKQRLQRSRRDIDGLQFGKVFDTLYAKALETSADVKTLLENTNKCDRIPNILEEIQKLKKNNGTCEKPRSCLELLRKGHTLSGVYKIYVETLDKDIEVYCDQETDGGGWIVFQRRKDGSVDFLRDWEDYKVGFGNVLGEFWLGNEYLSDLTIDCCHELRIDMKDFENNTRYAKYSKFMVGPKTKNYVLTAEGYSGDAGDSLGNHNGKSFSTKDADHDTNRQSCAQLFKGAWWYGSCHDSNLNGVYLGGAHQSYANGVIWEHWKGNFYSLKFVEMKFREITTE